MLKNEKKNAGFFLDLRWLPSRCTGFNINDVKLWENVGFSLHLRWMPSTCTGFNINDVKLRKKKTGIQLIKEEWLAGKKDET